MHAIASRILLETTTTHIPRYLGAKTPCFCQKWGFNIFKRLSRSFRQVCYIILQDIFALFHQDADVFHRASPTNLVQAPAGPSSSIRGLRIPAHDKRERRPFFETQFASLQPNEYQCCCELISFLPMTNTLKPVFGTVSLSPSEFSTVPFFWGWEPQVTTTKKGANVGSIFGSTEQL